MKSFAFLAVLALALSPSALAITGYNTRHLAEMIETDDTKMNPLCTKVLTNDKERYQCYSKIIRNLVMGVTKVNFDDLWESSQVFVPWMTSDIQGRGAPGKFYGITLNAEYLAVAWPAFVGPSRTNEDPDLNYFVATGHVATFQVNYLITDLPTNVSANWTITGWAKFTPDTNRMTHYDIDFRFYGGFLTQMGLLGNPPEVNQIISTTIANQLCPVIQAGCVGEDQQYESEASCVAYLEQRRFIPERLAIESDCLLCRQIHAILMTFDTKVHCPHVGPSDDLANFNGYENMRNPACSDQPFHLEFTFFDPKLWVAKGKWME